MGRICRKTTYDAQNKSVIEDEGGDIEDAVLTALWRRGNSEGDWSEETCKVPRKLIP